MGTNSSLTALSPLDGRYRRQLIEVSDLFSEFALILHRVKIEVLYLIFLSERHIIPKMTAKEKKILLKLLAEFSIENAQKIKEIERITKHDVKAVEYFLTDILKKMDSPLAPFVHIALTSEDDNSLSYSLMLLTAKETILVPYLKQILTELGDMIKDNSKVPMLARTHGQAAVPTTMGKEFSVFAQRILQELVLLEGIPIEGKLNGAVGNFSAHIVAFPQANWLRLSKEFVSSLGLTPAVATTQILPPESYSKIFDSLIRINCILLDFNQDIWRYISDGYLIQKLENGQVGSSTMPHKINPIDFENSEGNLGLANSLLSHFIQKLPISRLQRDLSDSTVKRNFGVAIGHCCLAYISLFNGLKKLSINKVKLKQELESHLEVITEAYQVILRVRGDVEGYQKLQKLTQGKHVTQMLLHKFVKTLNVSGKVKQQLIGITPLTYIGLSVDIANEVYKNINNYLKGSR